MADNTANIICRIDPELKKAFEMVAKERDLTASQMLRSYIRYEVEHFAKNNAQKDLFRATDSTTAKKSTDSPKKATKPPLEGRDGLLGMFKKKR